MDSNEYQKLAARTLIDGPEQPLSNSEISILNTVLAMHARLGELTEKLKKNILHRHQSYDTADFLDDGEKLLDDLTDIFENEKTTQSLQLTDQNTMILWNVIGLLGESSELAELLQELPLNMAFENAQGLEGRIKWRKELGDVAWYQAAIATKIGLLLDNIQEANIDKLKKRFPEGFTTKDSINRVDVQPEL